MNKELTIIIAGQANTGKSTMMLQLETLLKENGFDVELSFDSHPDYTGENTFHFHNKESINFNEKIKAIKNNTKIILKEMQINRETQKLNIKERYSKQIEVTDNN